jgi:hypothetical protein
MTPSEQDWIEKRAYQLWQEDGCPHGKDFDHWQQASAEFDAMRVTIEAKPKAPRKPTTRKASATKKPEGDTKKPEQPPAPKQKRKPT